MPVYEFHFHFNTDDIDICIYEKLSTLNYFSMELLLSPGAFLQRNLIKQSSRFPFYYVIH